MCMYIYIYIYVKFMIDRVYLKLLYGGRYVHINTSTHISQLSQSTMRKKGTTDKMGCSGRYIIQMFPSSNTETNYVHL